MKPVPAVSAFRFTTAHVLAALLVAGTVALLWIVSDRQPERVPGNGIELHSVLGSGGVAPEFDRADRPRTFTFPDDHGAHNDFRSEWWYFTGNLESEAGAPFAYQLTLFRNALGAAPQEPGAQQSAWRARQVYMGHFAITDVNGEAHYASERFAREAQALAGSQRDPFRVWVDDWTITRRGGSWQLTAGNAGRSISLSLKALKPPVLQGRDGLSVKSEGNASYYYSLTRMQTAGTLTLGTEQHRVSGLSWLDREWSTSSLSAGQSGWDWLSLQFDNGWELMFYQLRRVDGTADSYSAGVLVDPAGNATALPLDQFAMLPSRYWESDSGIRYPVAWQVSADAHELTLAVDAKVDSQEMPLAFRYWEGAVRAEGTFQGSPVTGSGFLELTGYGLGDEPHSGR